MQISCTKTSATEPDSEHSGAQPTTLVFPLDNGVKPALRRLIVTRGKRGLRRLHALLGLVSSLNLLVLIGSGFLLQHRDALRLDERLVSRKLLPGNYRTQDGREGVRADIVVTDLHSGRLLGATGVWVLDGITFGWLAMLLTGLVMYGLGRSADVNGGQSGRREGNAERTRS